MLEPLFLRFIYTVVPVMKSCQSENKIIVKVWKWIDGFDYD